MTTTTTNPGNYVVETESTEASTSREKPMKLTDRIKELMQEYKGSARYYQTDRGYAMIAAKLEDEGFHDVGRAIAFHRASRIIDRTLDEWAGQFGTEKWAV